VYAYIVVVVIQVLENVYRKREGSIDHNCVIPGPGQDMLFCIHLRGTEHVVYSRTFKLPRDEYSRLPESNSSDDRIAHTAVTSGTQT
jgi:hypothetical protein